MGHGADILGHGGQFGTLGGYWEPLEAYLASPATVWRAPRFATEGGQLAAGVVQCAILDLKEAEFGWQSELVTTKKCEFS